MQFFIFAIAVLALVGGIAVVRNYWVQRNLRMAACVAGGTLLLLFGLFMAFITI